MLQAERRPPVAHHAPQHGRLVVRNDCEHAVGTQLGADLQHKVGWIEQMIEHVDHDRDADRPVRHRRQIGHVGADVMRSATVEVRELLVHPLVRLEQPELVEISFSRCMPGDMPHVRADLEIVAAQRSRFDDRIEVAALRGVDRVRRHHAHVRRHVRVEFGKLVVTEEAWSKQQVAIGASRVGKKDLLGRKCFPIRMQVLNAHAFRTAFARHFHRPLGGAAERAVAGNELAGFHERASG